MQALAATTTRETRRQRLDSNNLAAINKNKDTGEKTSGNKTSEKTNADGVKHSHNENKVSPSTSHLRSSSRLNPKDKEKDQTSGEKTSKNTHKNSP